MFAFLSSLVSGIAAFFRLSEKRSDLANSSEMQANARAKLDQAARDAAIKALAADDLDAIRRQAAEE
jgi:hypothetical protein